MQRFALPWTVNLRRLAAVVLAMAVVGNLALSGFGYLVFNRASSSPLRIADVIVVLGGEHDGREEYGISLAQRGLAKTVLLSNPYRRDDVLMQRVCNAPYGEVEVICSKPTESTTRGEALMASDLMTRRRWRRVLVVTWKFHIPRTRFIFGQCLPSGSQASYVAVPRRYLYSLAVWEFQYIYQFSAFAKAALEPSCR